MQTSESENKLNIINVIPVILPERRILIRLGFRSHTTVVPEDRKISIKNLINEGFSLCEPMGVWARLPVINKSDDHVELSGGDRLVSRSLAKLLISSHAVLLMAATVGGEIVEAAKRMIDKGDGAGALIFDAVGSETADAAAGWINEYVRQILPRGNEKLTDKRFSPGYGDLGLENQKIIYSILELRNLGITLTERYMMIPEKSVIAIAGIERN